MSLISTILAKSPVVYYKLGEGSGTTATDSSGNGNNGTYHGGISYGLGGVPGDPGDTAIKLNGSTGYIDLPASIDASAFATLSLYICFYYATSPTNNDRLTANSHTDSDHNGFQMVINSGGGSGFSDIGTGSAQVNANWTNSISTGTWHDYLVTWTGSTLTVYIDGTSLQTASGSGSITASGYDINIGRNPAYNGDYSSARVAHFALFSTALSSTDATSFHSAMVTAPATVSRTVGSTAAIMATSSRTVGTSSALLTTGTRTTTTQAAILTTSTRTLGTSSAIQATTSRATNAQAALSTTNSRTMGASGALLATTSRALTPLAALLASGTRTIGASGALLATASRSMGASAALFSSSVPTAQQAIRGRAGTITLRGR